MSFGFAVGDFIAVGELAFKLYKDVYKVSRTAPIEAKELAKELSILSSSVKLLVEEARDPDSVLLQSGESRRIMVIEIISSTKETLARLEVYAKKHELLSDQPTSKPLVRRTWDKLKFSKDAGSINTLRARISYHCGVINMLLTSIGNSSLERLQSESESIARNTEEALKLLRTLTLDSRVSSEPYAGHMETSLNGLHGAEDVKYELSMEFSQYAALKDSCSWVEIGIDTWLKRGQRWWGEARYEIARLTILKRDGAHPADWKDVYRIALTAILKASWIIMDVVQNHPQRPHVTSSQHQLCIKHLASDVATELRALKELGDSYNMVGSMLDISDFDVTKHFERQEEGAILLVCHPSFTGLFDRATLPRFQCLAWVHVGWRQSMAKCLLSFEHTTIANERSRTTLTMLGPAGHRIELGLRAVPALIYRDIDTLPSKEPRRQDDRPWPICQIFTDFGGEYNYPLYFEVRSPLDMKPPFAGELCEIRVQLQSPHDEAVTALRTCLSDGLIRMNRFAIYLLDAIFRDAPKLLTQRWKLAPEEIEFGMHEFSLDEDVLLPELLARICLLNDIVDYASEINRRSTGDAPKEDLINDGTLQHDSSAMTDMKGGPNFRSQVFPGTFEDDGTARIPLAALLYEINQAIESSVGGPLVNPLGSRASPTEMMQIF